MRICVAQVRPLKGDIDKNIAHHKKLIDLAVVNGADIIVFPELSLTSYEPKLSEEQATTQADQRLDVFQTISDTKHITIGVGLPTNSHSGIMISMVIFQPSQVRQTYSKQQLHADELPYFVNGQQQVILTIGSHKIAPAICYESLLPEYAEKAFTDGAQVYLASVAKSAGGVAKAFKHYPNMAKQYAMTVAMSNCVGPCDDFESVGQSAIWNNHGLLVAQLDDTHEGILILDTDTEETVKKII